MLNKPVFFTSSLAILVLLIYAASNPDQANTFFQSLQDTVAQNGGWFYILTVAIILLTVVILGFSRYGDIRLGPDHATPEFSKLTWLSMLFAAGMGIGLMFFGVAEPVMHFLAPPTADPNSIAAVKEAMKTTFFHWGVHPWAIYAAVALVLGYFAYRHQLPLTLRSALYPLIGERIYGWPGHLVDIFAVTSTIFGVSTSLGFGAAQINAGLSYVFGIPSTTGVQIGLMAGVVGIAIISVTTGLDKGIRRLSEANMLLAVALLVFVLVLGPTVFLLQAYLQNMGAYASDIVRNTLNLFAYAKTDWIGGWTIFYWGWWLAWAPFVGLFIARISYGRTIREFVMGVLLIPTAFTLLWMTVFGNTAIDMVLVQGKDALASMVNEDTSVALFVFLENFPFSSVLTLLAVLMVVIFFVTSCDSGAMVVDMLCSNGRNDTPLWQRIYWAVSVGVVASILLYAGGLGALQTMTIVAALPFSVILLVALFGLMKALRVEDYKRESMQISGFQTSTGDSDKNWRSRLENIVSFPNKKAVKRFLDKTVLPAFNDVKAEFGKLNFDVEIEQTDKFMMLTVKLNEQPDFIYAVYPTSTVQPDLNGTLDIDSDDTYYRAEVHLSEGGQGYDIMGWSTLAVINDVIDQYHKHQHFLHRLV
ncbi:choline BCCT transporter BetT [Alteromonas sp. 1_MG-2023]|uniref:BCCT family transporter n=1 Tax=Alteromonas sp. 1_MG-2023 TaxID=3062669 RepID=UPI0026E2E9B7|nr:choline BCCT transporter BetT [Alteromonas sp. 1_MG-2023]MDO6476381.1 choline BCCT transporter BetT [Alteromonas sp. 1_MG-2023]